MKAVELLDLLSYPRGQKLWLQPYEKTFIKQRAREEKLSNKEMKILNEILREDKYEKENIDYHKIIYNLETGESMTLHDLYKKTKLPMTVINDRIVNKICISNRPYSYDKNESPLFYRLRYNDIRFVLYRCEELGIALSDKEWKEYFNDPSIKMAYYGQKGKNYKGYTFKGTNLYIDYIGGKRK